MPSSASCALPCVSPDTKGWVVFLDVDGVLLPVARQSFGGGELDFLCVKRLEKLVEFLQNGAEQQKKQPNGNKEEKRPNNTSLSAPEEVEKKENGDSSNIENEPTSSCYPVTFILSSTWRRYPDMVSRLNRFFCKHCAVDPREKENYDTSRENTGNDGMHVARTSLTEKAGENHQDIMNHYFPLASGGTPNGTVLTSSVAYYADDPSEQRLVRDRVDEIFAWLHEHVEDHPEGIGGRWLAIDDLKLDMDERMRGHFIHTKTEVGLTDEDVEGAKQWIREGLATVEEARKAAIAARVDPALFEEKIAIGRVLGERLQLQLEEITKEKDEKEKKLHEVTEVCRQTEKQLKELKRQHEEVAYRLALLEYSKKIPFLDELVQIAKKTSGKERKELDNKIAQYVQLLQRQKAIENAMRKERKKNVVGEEKM